MSHLVRVSNVIRAEILNVQRLTRTRSKTNMNGPNGQRLLGMQKGWVTLLDQVLPMVHAAAVLLPVWHGNCAHPLNYVKHPLPIAQQT